MICAHRWTARRVLWFGSFMLWDSGLQLCDCSPTPPRVNNALRVHGYNAVKAAVPSSNSATTTGP